MFCYSGATLNAVKHEDIMKFMAEQDRPDGPPLPKPPVTEEEIAQLRAALAEMDGHLTEELMLNLRIEVERVIAWEDRHEIEQHAAK